MVVWVVAGYFSVVWFAGWFVVRGKECQSVMVKFGGVVVIVALIGVLIGYILNSKCAANSLVILFILIKDLCYLIFRFHFISVSKKL